VLRWHGRGTVAISTAELQRLSRIDSRRARSVMHDPFRITVREGSITALRQLRYR
jgi:predicted metalloprotease